MCGIAGIVSMPDRLVSTKVMETMLETIRHRGPDDWGMDLLRSDGVILGNVRLAVIDLSNAAHQPMWTNDRSLCIVYNGEIYNFRELRIELEKSGHQFVSGSDTEVILQGYRYWGSAVCERLNGMFAFAIWDTRRQHLFMARDRLGKKPFYYWKRGMTFVFASEIKALLCHPGVPRAVNPISLQCYLALGYTPAPLTMFSEIQKLPAGHWGTLQPGGELQISRYWSLPTVAIDLPSRHELRCQIREQVEAAVARRLIADVPFGAFLSGGVDSSIVVGVMSRLVRQPVRTFSTAFEVGSRSFKYNVDADAAANVSRHFQTEHVELRITDDQIVPCIHDLVSHLDEPITTPMFQTYLLAAEVKKCGVTVILSGDGSDEVFGGYTRYTRNRIVDVLALLPTQVLQGLGRTLKRMGCGDSLMLAARKAATPPFSPARYLEWWQYLDRDARARFTAPPVADLVNVPEEILRNLISVAPANSSTDLIAYLDLLLWIAEDSNMRMDKMCMAHSIESRAPFLDYRVVELGLSIPFAKKASWTVGKKLLREAFADLLPTQVINRPKWGWWGPIYYWMQGPLRELTSRALATLPRTGMFNDSVMAIQTAVPALEPMVVWKLVLWALWYDTYIEPFGLRDAA